MLKLFSFLSLFFSFLIFAQHDLEYAFDKIKDSGGNYEIVGTVCEELAKLEFEEDYPKERYAIIGQIEYANMYNKVLGELDLVIFDATTDRAIIIAEVKCWKNLSKAHKKAIAQQNRFKSHLLDKGLKIYSRSSEDESFFQANQFTDEPVFISISQEGGEKAGFEETIPYSLDEIYKLQIRLRACQKSGECAPVIH